MQRFSEDEAQEILRRAARVPSQEVTQDELLQSAAELGISPESLARAQVEVREDRVRREFDRVLQSHVRNEVVTFVAVMAGLIAINLLTSRAHLWFFYPLVFWGMCVASTVLKTRNRESEGYRRAFKKWQENDGNISKEKLAKMLEKG